MAAVFWLSGCNSVFSRLEWSSVLSTRTAFEGAIDGHRQLLIAESFIQSLLTQGKDPCLLITLPSLPLKVDTISCLSSQLIIFNQEQQLILVIFCGQDVPDMLGKTGLFNTQSI